MDSIKIKAFTAICKYGSFSKAADEFSYTPSAFSHIADSIEQELSVKLFNRSRTGITLTDEGRELAKYFENLSHAEDLLLTRADELSKKGTVRIGAFSSISKNYLPKIIGDFKRSHPDIKIEMTVGDNVNTLFASDRLDVVISTFKNIPEATWHSLFDDPFVAVFSAKEDADECPNKEALYKYNYINTQDEDVNVHLELDRFAEIIQFESADYDSVISMIREGVGMSILPLIEIKNKLDGIKYIYLDEEFKRTIGIMYKNSALKNKELSKFISHIKNHATP